MPSPRFEYLFNCYLTNNCTKEEKEELMKFLAKPENSAIAETLIDRVIETTVSETALPEEKANSILQNIFHQDKQDVQPYTEGRTIVFGTWLRMAAAAIIILVAGTIFWITDKNDKQAPKVAAKRSAPDLKGANKAVLILADGSSIILDTAKNGTLTNVGSTNINKNDGVLVYDAQLASTVDAPVSYNTLSTPKGTQYKLVLPDGSKVWLNAASSLRFPTAFTGTQREVELTGEAYFEVAKNKAKPFQVNVGAMHVNVLGTHFNVNAYTEERSIKTSLLEGSVKVIEGNSTNMLKPGEQAVLTLKDDKVKIRNVDMDEVVSWKNGLFLFEEADISSIMRQVTRWYDVEVVYAGKVPVQRFEGKISRSAALTEVLQILQLSNVKFKVEGKRITVL